jgi:LysM domain/Transglycosylase SLT domain
LLLLERSLEDWERLLAGSCKFTLKKEGTLQTHQYIQKYLHEVGTYVQQHRGGRFVVRIGMGLVATLALFVTFFGMGAQGASAHTLAACSAGDRAYSVASGDTLGTIAARYGSNWSVLASHNGIANANLIYVGQTVCIPSGSASAYVAPATSQSSAPVAYTASAPAYQGGSVASMIYQVFGASGATAVSIATCESGLNPGATNPYSGAAGVFQIMPGTWSGTSYAGYSAYNAWANINAAHQVFVRDGYSWREWVC